jgi:hypothetical protein
MHRGHISYCTENMLCLGNEAQPVNAGLQAMFENRGKYVIHSVSDMNGFLNVKAGGTYIE